MTVMKAPALAEALPPVVFLAPSPEATLEFGVADPILVHLQTLGEMGLGHVQAGEESAALQVRDMARHRTHTDTADEITLAVMEAQLARGDAATGSARLGEISPNMKAWGILKMQKYGLRPQRWQELRYPLENAWQQYNLRQQREIITDLLAMGEYHCATHFANRMAPGDSVQIEREARRDTLIAIAHHQANNGDVQSGLALVAELQQEAETALGNIILERMNLPEYPENPEDSAALTDVTIRHSEYANAYNTAEMHAIALRAYQTTTRAEQLLARAAFYNEDPNLRHHQARARGVLDATLLNLSLHATAPRAASQPESPRAERGLLTSATGLVMKGVRRAAARLSRFTRPI
jgi:hypothetical protein